jgi:Phosphotransferase system sorbitol-specific component IIA
MQQGTIVTIGEQAMDPKERMLIFFGEKVTDGLRPHSIIQQLDNPQAIELNVGSTILFGDQEYQVTYVGHLATQNIQTIQHVTFVFSDVPTEKLSSSVYLTPTKLPTLTEGMKITYKG